MLLGDHDYNDAKMTLIVAATVMANLLAGGNHDR
jgi:hypothetical protein